ncbi:tetratricopeptide repeat protein [Modestobacter marinus]|uniref:tetratricopeptide repeat protein n=1 Tax=Modestobacter marinus TaxID=477641 RepID=UPI0034D7A209
MRGTRPRRPHDRDWIYRRYLGNVLADQGDFACARPSWERALEITEVAFGQNHVDVEANRGNLGRVLRDFGVPAACAVDSSRLHAGEKRCYTRRLRPNPGGDVPPGLDTGPRRILRASRLPRWKFWRTADTREPDD